MPLPIRGLGYFSCEDKSEEFDFARKYANNLSEIKAEYKARGVLPTKEDVTHARIKSAALFKHVSSVKTTGIFYPGFYLL